jgi:ferric-dicitrate binding protein FerR (iron transport regulator)
MQRPAYHRSVAGRIRRWLASDSTDSTERDEAAAQAYWLQRYEAHPEELIRANRVRSAPAEPSLERHPPPPEARRKLTKFLLIFNLVLAAAQGIGTVVLALVGATSDIVWVSVTWTVV